MRGGVCRCLTHACQRARRRGADGTALPFRVCEYGSLSSQPWTDTHRWVSIYIHYTHTHPAVYAYRRTRVPPRRICATYATRRACGRALVCVRWRDRIRADVCEHFTSPPSVALIGSQAIDSASAFNANIGAWNTARVTTLFYVCAARMMACCMRANYENLSSFWHKVLYSCVKMSISLCVCADGPCPHPPLHTRARVCGHVLLRVRVRVHLARHPWVGYIQIYTHGNIYKYGFSAMPCAWVCVGASPMHANVPVCAGLTARRCPFVCASTVPPPHSHGPTHGDGSVFIYIIYTTLPCMPIVVRAYRRGGYAPCTRPGVRACTRSCLCAGATASAPTCGSTSRRRRASR
jgi:hypothetical protein